MKLYDMIRLIEAEEPFEAVDEIECLRQVDQKCFIDSIGSIYFFEGI